MKKITLLLTVLLSISGFSQCLTATNGQYPSATFTPNNSNCDGISEQTVTTVGWAGEFSVVAVTEGQTYTFKSSIATDIITISTDAGATAATFGTGSVTWISTLTGNVRFYTHITGCGAENISRVRKLVCGIPSNDEPDFASLHYPVSGTINAGENLTVYGRVFEAGVTDVTTGQVAGIQAWVGYSTTNSNPNTWSNWVAATFSTDAGDNDEYQANIGATLNPGTYYYATRYRLNNGPFVYGGIAVNYEGSFWNGTTFNSGVLTVNAPVNDNFASATAVACAGTYNGNTSLATLDEDNAPDGFGADMDAPNLWYSFTGSGTAQTVTASLCDSSYDTSILVYTGTSGNLTLVAGNDDDSSCGTRSKVVFNSDGATTYYIAVEGYNPTSTGAFVLNVTCADVIPPAVANQDCGTSLLVNVDGTDNLSDNSYGTVSAAQPSCDSFGVIQDVWFSFVAPSNGEVICNVSLGTITSLNFNVYSGVCESLTPVAGACNANLTATGVENLTGLTGGATYYVQVWSNAAEQGTFTLRLDPTLGTDTFDNSKISIYPNPAKDNLNFASNVTIEKVEIFNLLGQNVLSNQASNIETLNISHLTKGNYVVKVTTANNESQNFKLIKN